MQYERSGNVIRPDSGGDTKETVSPVSAPFRPKKDVVAKSSSVSQPPQIGPVDLRLTCHDVGGTSEHQTRVVMKVGVRLCALSFVEPEKSKV